MKKIIAVTIVALMMFALATSAFALLPVSSQAYKNPPVFIDSLVVSDAYMTGLTVQNWTGSLTNQAYAAGSYIWFIAKIGVAAEGDTDAAFLWDSATADSAELTFTSKDNCLDFTSANNARLSRIWGQNVRTESVRNNLSLVEATSKSAKFIFRPSMYSRVETYLQDYTLLFDNIDLGGLRLDMIYPKDKVAANGTNGALATTGGVNRATLQKDFYLHFMAITKEATEGVCIGTMKVNGETEFERWTSTGSPTDYQSANPWAWGGVVQTPTTTTSSTKLVHGDRSIPYLLFNSVNNKTYAIAKISGESPNANTVGPYGNGGSYYLVMNTDMDTLYVGFVVKDGAFRGLVRWWDDKPAIAGNRDGQAAGAKVGSFNYNNSKCWDAANYVAMASNDLSSDVALLTNIYGTGTMATADLQAIFDFFGFLYSNPRSPSDADFLGRSGLVTVAEAKYNVANATVTVPDTTVVIPKTGDAATSTGLILVASAILAAAAVGFVLSKRAHN